MLVVCCVCAESGVCENRDGWLVAWGFVGDWLFVFPLCGFSLSLFCNYRIWHHVKLERELAPAPVLA